RDDRRQLTGTNNVFSSWIGISTVRRFWAGNEINNVFQSDRIQCQHFLDDGRSGGVGLLIPFVVGISYLFLGPLTCLYIFLRLLPIDSHDEVLVLLRSIDFQKRKGHLSIVSGEEEPAVRLVFTGASQVKVERRGFDLEGQIHVSGFRIHPDEGDVPFEIVLVGVNGYVLVIPYRYRESGTSYHILGILGNKWRGVITCRVGDFNDFHGFEGVQIYSGNAWSVVGISKRPSRVMLRIGCGD